ncbi:hypothetical protein NLI96_g1045 [Meripilus lineatus]|uniref:Uncharacterized protein n=1 Tax=Meripilus lineatus TaxID=2056292 RepID=A0AAD5YIT0_9APHY|nr:hypothetical protein NLI96_g1045 [Physisporinus lineatus]
MSTPPPDLRRATSEEFLAWFNEPDPEQGSGRLDSREIFWRDHQVWLQEKGYMLRPRYHPGWIPPRKGDPRILRFDEDTLRIQVQFS